MKHYHYTKFSTAHGVYQKAPGSWLMMEKPNIEEACKYLELQELCQWQDSSSHTPSTWEFMDPVGKIMQVSEHAAIVLTTEDNFVWVVVEDDVDVDPAAIIEEGLSLFAQ